MVNAMRTGMKRIPIALSHFTPEILELFLALEKVSPRKRFADPRSKRLAELLNLTSEYWTVNHVNDPSPRPCHRPPYQSYTDWHVCRAMREELLAATRTAASAT
jgi:hypothetical protein